MTAATVAAEPAVRPGLGTDRLVRLMRRAVEECRLDLSGAVVLTEAATGPYVVTPVLAALAGAADVVALTRDTRYGTAAEVTRQTLALAAAAGVAAGSPSPPTGARRTSPAPTW
jgi:hypothetical protein